MENTKIYYIRFAKETAKRDSFFEYSDEVYIRKGAVWFVEKGTELERLADLINIVQKQNCFSAEEAATIFGTTPDSIKAALDDFTKAVAVHKDALYMDVNAVVGSEYQRAAIDKRNPEPQKAIQDLIDSGDYYRWRAYLYEYANEEELEECDSWTEHLVAKSSWYYATDYYEEQLAEYAK